MKHIKYGILAILAYGSAYSFSDKSFMTYRSQGFNLARSNSGWFRQCTDNNASLAIEYTRSFDASAINNYYFGDNSLVFSGSRRADRGSCDILADYFGLPTDFKSVVSFCPRVQNVITEVDSYWLIGRDCDSRFNVRLTFPIVHTKWELNPCEQVLEEGSQDYPAGYMGRSLMTHDMLNKGALDVLSRGAIFGDMGVPLQYGRLATNQCSLTRVADIFVALGYNLICCDNASGLLDLHVVVPTGTRSESRCLFEPQIGNGHHWALGVGWTSHYDFVANQECDLVVSAHLDARIQHLFASTQKRSYDFKGNGPGSRYMLVMDMVGNIGAAQGFSPIPAVDLFQRQYISRLYYGLDVATFESKISVAVQADILASLSVSRRNWNAQVGYNVWARSHETLKSREMLNYKYYGIKGDAQLYGFLQLGPDLALPIPMDVSQSHATIHAPQGNGNTVNNYVNSNADNAALTWNVSIPMAQTDLVSASNPNTGIITLEQINGSNQAVTLTDVDIQDCSGLSDRAITQKVVGWIGYDYDCNNHHWYGLIGAEGEFASKTGCTKPALDDCAMRAARAKKTAISQWGVWIKGGLNY